MENPDPPRLHITLQFDLRWPEWAACTREQLYATALEVCTWADDRDVDRITFLEHHLAEDGYLPAPLIASAAAAARTTEIEISPVLLAPLYDPLRLAEELAVLDVVSAGRTAPIIAGGYRSAEFDMFGVERRRRGRLVERAVTVLKDAWTGQPFTFEGHQVTVRPTPSQQPRPPIYLGGSSTAAAKRAARIADDFFPTASATLHEEYRAELVALGRPDPGPRAHMDFFYLTEDPDKARAQLLPHIRHSVNSYAMWTAEDLPTVRFDPIETTDDLLDQQLLYPILTPDECIKRLRLLGPHVMLKYQPLRGAMPPELAWPSLELLINKVAPAVRTEFAAVAPANAQTDA